MTGDIFTSDIPTDPGWYWIQQTVHARNKVNSHCPPKILESAVMEMLLIGNELYLDDIETDWFERGSISVADIRSQKYGYEFKFGPRVPSPDQLRKLWCLVHYIQDTIRTDEPEGDEYQFSPLLTRLRQMADECDQAYGR